jgi:adenosine deaminase
MIEALDAGFREAEEDGLASVGLCISLLRQQSSEEAIELVDLLLALRHPRVVALSIDGNEAAAGRTGPRFAEAFRRAGAGGLKRAVHAGESSGPEGVWDAIDLLGADRIDHGVRAIEDAELVEVLVERQIPLDICPTSNLTLGLYPSIAAHPFDTFRKKGIPVSINTDDPALLDLHLPTEYAVLAATFGWSGQTVRDVAATSITASFANDDVKSRLLADLDAWYSATDGR